MMLLSLLTPPSPWGVSNFPGLFMLCSLRAEFRIARARIGSEPPMCPRSA